MRALIQRVSKAHVSVEKRIVGQINKGLVIFLAVRIGDTERQAETLSNKIVGLRIFPNTDGKLDYSLSEVAGSLLVISQFTLLANTRKGRRPSFDDAADADTAKALYEYFLDRCRLHGVRVATGVFQADMDVDLTNQGPLTLLLDTPNTSAKRES